MHILEPIEEVKPLTNDERDKLASTIASNFHTWDDARSEQISTAKEIMKEVYLNQDKRQFAKGQEWKSDVKLNALYNIKKTKKAVLWREMWSNPSQMFDVRGTNKATEETAKQQKAAIVDALTKMDVGKQFDYATDNLYDIGEMVFKTDWETRSKVVKRQVKDIGFVFQNLVRQIGFSGIVPEQKAMKEIELPYYENARVESISPFMFVFDFAKWDFKQESWKKLIKISKRFESLDDLKQNRLYNITPEMISELNENKDGVSESDKKDTAELREMSQYGGKYSVLYAHGDFKINGKVYKNYIAEVLADKYLIRFEENPLWICPFIMCALEYDPSTKRGISPLKASLGMCQKEEDLANTAFDAQKLMMNPPSWVTESLIEGKTDKEGNIKVAPGKYIVIKDDFNGTMPVPMTISSAGISDLLGFINNRISEVSSVSDVMFGNIESSKRTATELSLADKGSSSQASKELDTINQDLTLPMIENVAELLAMFKDGKEILFYEEKGKREEIEITNAIRQAQYNYYYEDRNAMIERKSRFGELFQLFKEVGQNEVLFNMIDWKETIIAAVEMIGFDNSDKFFKDETPLAQMVSKLEQMPPEAQQQLIPVMENAAQQYVNQMQMQAMSQRDFMEQGLKQQAQQVQMQQQMMQQVPQI